LPILVARPPWPKTDPSGFSYDDLARLLGKPTADAARKTAQRALVRLAEEMQRGNE
jgi:hypothetical protein